MSGPDGKTTGKKKDGPPEPSLSGVLAHELAEGARQRGQGQHGTQYFRGLIQQTVGRSSLPLKMAVIWGSVLLLLGGTTLGLLLWRREGRLDAERLRLTGEIMRLSAASEGEEQRLRLRQAEEQKQNVAARQQQQRRLTELSGQLAQLQGGGTGARIATENRHNVYLLIGGSEGKLAGFCTGFAVRKRTLATNAHCVKGAQAIQERGGKIFAVQNGQRRRWPISRMVAHQGYRKEALGADVGLMQVATLLPSLVRTASTAQLRAVSQGGTMYTYGFPGSLARPEHPEATITQGIISRLMTPQRSSGTFEQARILQHTAFVTGGTSGSPVFDAHGWVIAINSGGFTTRQRVSVSTSDGKVTPLLLTSAAAGYAYAMRIDLMRELYRLLPE